MHQSGVDFVARKKRRRHRDDGHPKIPSLTGIQQENMLLAMHGDDSIDEQTIRIVHEYMNRPLPAPQLRPQPPVMPSPRLTPFPPDEPPPSRWKGPDRTKRPIGMSRDQAKQLGYGEETPESCPSTPPGEPTQPRLALYYQNRMNEGTRDASKTMPVVHSCRVVVSDQESAVLFNEPPVVIHDSHDDSSILMVDTDDSPTPLGTIDLVQDAGPAPSWHHKEASALSEQEPSPKPPDKPPPNHILHPHETVRFISARFASDISLDLKSLSSRATNLVYSSGGSEFPSSACTGSAADNTTAKVSKAVPAPRAATHAPATASQPATSAPPGRVPLIRLSSQQLLLCKKESQEEFLSPKSKFGGQPPCSYIHQL